jgi:hypothetical protein
MEEKKGRTKYSVEGRYQQGRHSKVGRGIPMNRHYFYKKGGAEKKNQNASKMTWKMKKETCPRGEKERKEGKEGRKKERRKSKAD